MTKSLLRLLVVLALALVLGVPSCWAKENGYCYIVSYSQEARRAYITPVFVAKVSGATYSDEEFVADVELIRKMEGQFNRYLAGKGMSSVDLVTSARVAYRSQAIAEKRLADEKSDFKRRGFDIEEADQFKFK